MRVHGKRAARPCPWRLLGHYSAKSKCSADTVSRYRSRISGPLPDRIDLHVEVAALPPGDLSTGRQGVPNARVAGHDIASHGAPSGPARKLLTSAVSRMGISARAHHRVLKVARSIADLEGRSRVADDDVPEARSYRVAANAA